MLVTCLCLWYYLTKIGGVLLCLCIARNVEEL